VQAILSELGALMGVKGSFVCDRDGGLVGRAMPEGMTDAGLAAIGRSLMQTLNGLEIDRRKRPSELDFVFANGMMLVKNLGVGCLCVLCARQANVAMVNMTANMAVRKLKDVLSAPARASAAAPPAVAPAAAPAAAPPPSPAPAAAPEAAVVASPAGEAGGPPLGAALVSQIEHELARAVGPVAMFAVDDAAAAMGFTRQTLPAASAAGWIERLGGEIADAGKKAHFLEAARQLARVA
jgi:predicted regulator of Ras-like GTPase activity (Roadblock/LC7/MglB family)